MAMRGQREDPVTIAQTSPPTVSIITATYNRSSVLRHAISSVLRSTVRDWELLVIGDACTDDSEQVVSSFGDPRIRFVNLERNAGEQSGPNNHGGRLARGRYVAYLNHDDLGFPDHLELLLRGIEETGADLVYGLGAVLYPDGTSVLTSLPFGIPASTWLFRRELIADVGPWRSYGEVYEAPSQDWLHRASRAKKKIVPLPVLTAVLLPSGGRRDSYARSMDGEHRRCGERMTLDPAFRADLHRRSTQRTDWGTPEARARALRRLAWRTFFGVIHRFGANPRVVYSILLRKRKGHVIDHLRRVRGLDDLRQRNEDRK
jgi:glycosyltransferase involved in cell wall biosynthesis